MPFISIMSVKKLDDNTKNKLQLQIGNVMPTIPTKTIGNTVICINDGCSMYKNGIPLEGLFVDVRLYKNSPDEAKKEFSEILFGIFKETLGVPPECVQINYVELPNWASNGSYK